MKLRLDRNWLIGDTTTGKLYVNGKFHSFTLEDKVRNEKIYGETAIPYGSYEVDRTWSPRFQVKMPLIKNVPNFEGIRIHTGSSALSTSGCLLVGKSLTEDKQRLINSKIAFDDLDNKIKQAIERGEKITIDIVAPDVKQGIIWGSIGVTLIGLGIAIYFYFK